MDRSPAAIVLTGIGSNGSRTDGTERTEMINGLGSSGGGPTGMLTPGGQLGKEEFLQLLVAQLRHQDPMNPMSSDEFAVQLAQFSNVEQLMMVNEQLAAQGAYTEALAQAMNSSGAVGVLGHEVTAVGNQIQVTDGAASATVEVGGVGGDAVVRVYDENNNLVAELDLGFVGAGRHNLALEGLDGVEDGAYRYELKVTDAAGDSVRSTTFVRGTVSGVQYGMNGPVLMIGKIEVPLNAVVEVSVN
jgi:flagellar basal-body rod modification protein FlgD